MKKSFKNQIISFVIDDIIKMYILKYLPDKLSISFDYLHIKKRILNLNNPKTYSEKIQWIKIYGGLEKYAKYVDKYEVRDYVSKTIGKTHLIPLLGVWKKFDEIQFDRLPQKFVLKATHGSGYNYICNDKSIIDKKVLKITFDKWLQENYYKNLRESQYKHCTPLIICEKYFEDKIGNLTDYKFFCKDGEPKLIMINSNRFKGHTLDVLDINWEKLPVFYAHPNSKKLPSKPDNYQEMIEISKKLSKIFPFVRVDLYSVKNKIYFGELTFTPGSGLETIKPLEAECLLGELIDISKYNK